MSETEPTTSAERKGALFAGGAYVIWGLMPLYWRQLHEVPPFELTVHRVLWCAVVVGVVTATRGRLDSIGAILRTPRTLATLALTSALITGNWTLYLYAVATNQLVEAAFAYYLLPLISFVLGVVFFHERPSRLRWMCVGLAAVGVTLQIIQMGRLPWLSLSLSVSFALYGYFRKLAPVAAVDGLLVETGLAFPFALALTVWWFVRHEGAFLAGSLTRDGLLMFGGALTAIPLGMFAAGVRRLRLTTLGFLQYLSPSISLLLAIFGFHERFTAADLMSFAIVWVAIVIVAFEGRFRRPSPA